MAWALLVAVKLWPAAIEKEPAAAVSVPLLRADASVGSEAAAGDVKRAPRS